MQRVPSLQLQATLPASALKTIPLTCPFAVWGLDMVGPFKTARGGMTHLLVAVDKFTKWIEAKPIKKLNEPTIVTFMQILPSGMAYRTASSPTTAQTLPKEHWHVSARRRVSDWT